MTPAVVATTDRATSDRRRIMSHRSKTQIGGVYVIHLATRLHHAGFVTNLPGRIL